MNPFENLNKFFDRREWIRLIRESVIETLSEVEDLQTDQFSVGQNSEGKEIGQLRNDAYARVKKAKGGKAPFGVVDLKDTGDFYSGIIAKLESKFISVTSTDKKTKELEEKYDRNGDIFALNETYLQKYIDLLIPVIQDNLNRWLQLNLAQLQ